MSTTSQGKKAEEIVAKRLKQQGYEILDKNWRTRYCEIDVIAKKSGVVAFVEVKYRQNSNWGDGLEAITAKKQKQMTFAAEMWISQNNWQGSACLKAASVAGDPPQILDIIDL